LIAEVRAANELLSDVACIIAICLDAGVACWGYGQSRRGPAALMTLILYITNN